MKDTYWDKRAITYGNLEWIKSSDFDRILSYFISELIYISNDRFSTIDLGTGTGKVAHMLSMFDLVETVYAVDISEEMLSQIPENSKILPILGDVTDIISLVNTIFLKPSIKVVTARMLFHHLTNPHQVLKNIWHILDPGGIVVICEGNPPGHLEIPLYEEIFKHKEERVVVTESVLVNWLDSAMFGDITLKPYWLRHASLKNWIENSGIPDEKKNIIWELHRNAPESWKQAYHYIETEDDILMDWKFTVAVGKKYE